ncbi:MAG: hypothetical protein J5651_00220 [Salinivirgaceae bacterium]|nr:hypothetical protein [Salinivirgaceae bacterium]
MAGMKFNPFTGKLDIVGMSEERFAELADLESTINDGEMFESHGGFTISGQSYDFGAEGNAMTVKEILKKILLKKKRAELKATGGFDQFVNVNTNCTPAFTITKKSYPIKKIVIVRKDADNNTIETLSIEAASKSYNDDTTGDGHRVLSDISFKSGNTALSVDSLFGADGDLIVTTLTITMPQRAVQANNTWTCTITEDTADADKGEPTKLETASVAVAARFYFPKLAIIADYAGLNTEASKTKIALKYDTVNKKLSIKRMPDGSDFYSKTIFDATASYTLTGLGLFEKTSNNPGGVNFSAAGQTLCIISKEKKVGNEWVETFDHLQDFDLGKAVSVISRQISISIYLDDSSEPITDSELTRWHLYFPNSGYNPGWQAFSAHFK